MALDLLLGAADLIGTPNTDPDGFWIETGAGSLPNWGSAEDIEQEIESFLQDGTDIAVVRRGNRQLIIPIRVRANSVKGLGVGIESLQVELGKHNTLTYTPSGNGSTCVFEVVTASAEPEDDDSSKVLPLRAKYSLTVKALPWVRPTSLTSVTWGAPPAGSLTVTTVDPCTSTTGWSGLLSYPTVSVTPVTSSGSVGVSYSNSSGASAMKRLGLTRSGLSVSMASTPYLRVDYGITILGATSIDPPELRINTSLVSPIATSGTVGWYAMPGGATTLTSWEVAQRAQVNNGGSIVVSVADISRSSSPGDVPSGTRQTFRTVSIAGTARTQGSIALADGSGTPQGLGTLLVYTVPNNVPLAQPNLRARLWSGSGVTETADTSAISGKTSPISTGLTGFDTPASQLPSGSYLLLGRVKNSSTGDYDLEATGYSVVNGNIISDLDVRQQTVHLIANTWKTLTLGLFNLPLTQMGPTGLTRLAISSSSSGLVLDDMWVFNMDLGRLTWLECGTGNASAGGGGSTGGVVTGAASRAWLDAATLDDPASASIGYRSDRADSFDAGLVKFASGNHELQPGLMNVFTASSGSTAMSGEIDFYPHYGHRVP